MHNTCVQDIFLPFAQLPRGGGWGVGGWGLGVGGLGGSEARACHRSASAIWTFNLEANILGVGSLLRQTSELP